MPRNVDAGSIYDICSEMGWEAVERLRFLASFPLPGTGKVRAGTLPLAGTE